MRLIGLWDPSKREPEWKVYALAEGNECPVLERLGAWSTTRQFQAYADGLMNLIERISNDPRGPDLFHGNRAICHEAVEGERIFRLRKGPLRLYWFYGEERRVVICPFCEQKRSDKVEASTQRLLVAARDAYVVASQSMQIEIGF